MVLTQVVDRTVARAVVSSPIVKNSVVTRRLRFEKGSSEAGGWLLANTGCLATCLRISNAGRLTPSVALASRPAIYFTLS